MSSRSARVVFDFEGSLEVARRSWAAADLLQDLRRHRQAHATEALVGWSGTYGSEFAGRIDTELTCAADLEGQLRAEATGWAAEWKHAMDQENWHRYQDACDRVRSDRSVVDHIAGFFTGHGDLPPEPSTATTPNPPMFVATRRFVEY